MDDIQTQNEEIQQEKPVEEIQVENKPAVEEKPELVFPKIEEVSIEAPYGYKKDGTPAKRRGRQPLDPGEKLDRLNSVTPAPARPLDQKGVTPSGVIPTNHKALGELAANLWFNIPQIIFGSDWEPDVKSNEPQIISSAFTDYFKAKNITTIDPTLALCLALSSYTLSRVNKPTVKSKFQGIALWIKSKLKR